MFSFENLRVYKASHLRKRYISPEIAFGSMTEVFCELQLDALRPQFTEVAKMLSGLRQLFNRSLGYAAWLVQEPLTFNLYR